MNRQLIRSLAIILLAFGLFVVVAKTTPMRQWDDQLFLLTQVRHLILEHFVEEPDEDAMMRAAAKAMAESLGDPHTTYIPPEDLQQWDEQVTGRFSGIGATVEVIDDRPRIVSPLDDSPAYRAGVMAGDVILEIEGEDTRGMNINDVVNRLRGERGTEVTIRVRHETGEEAEITIERDDISVPTVRGLLRGDEQRWKYLFDDENRIGYIRISQFTRQTASDLEQVLDDLMGEDPAGLVLDVRFNPGGLLSSAVDVASLFLDGEKQVVEVRGRRDDIARTYRAREGESMAGVPIVVVANEASASASEILAGALSDHGRAAIVGTRTFGKGSVQEVIPLQNGLGALKITNAHYYLPGGRNINRMPDSEVWGVDPDEGNYVPMSSQQVRRMREVRRDLDALRPDNNQQREAVTPDWIEQELSDPQLAAAHRAILGRIADGEWPKVGEDGGDLLAFETRRRNLERQRELLGERLEEIEDQLERITREEDEDDPEAANDIDATEDEQDVEMLIDELERLDEQAPPLPDEVDDDGEVDPSGIEQGEEAPVEQP